MTGWSSCLSSNLSCHCSPRDLFDFLSRTNQASPIWFMLWPDLSCTATDWLCCDTLLPVLPSLRWSPPWPFWCWKGQGVHGRDQLRTCHPPLAAPGSQQYPTTCSPQTSWGNFRWKTESSIKCMQTGFSSACNIAKFEHTFRELGQYVFLTESCLLPNFMCNASKH